MVKKEFRIIVDVEEDDFCLLDLKECIIDGSDNVGNHTVNDVIAIIDGLETEIN